MATDQIGPRTYVSVGKAVEITHAEVLLLKQHAREMDRHAFHQSKGWFLAYLTAHRDSAMVLQTIMRRSHAN